MKKVEFVFNWARLNQYVANDKYHDANFRVTMDAAEKEKFVFNWARLSQYEIEFTLVVLFQLAKLLMLEPYELIKFGWSGWKKHSVDAYNASVIV